MVGWEWMSNNKTKQNTFSRIEILKKCVKKMIKGNYRNLSTKTILAQKSFAH